jgi:hypothetical protein
MNEYRKPEVTVLGNAASLIRARSQAVATQ